MAGLIRMAGKGGGERNAGHDWTGRNAPGQAVTYGGSYNNDSADRADRDEQVRRESQARGGLCGLGKTYGRWQPASDGGTGLTDKLIVLLAFAGDHEYV